MLTRNVCSSYQEQINKAKENAPRKSLLDDDDDDGEDDDDESADEPIIGPVPVQGDQNKKEYGSRK